MNRQVIDLAKDHEVIDLAKDHEIIQLNGEDWKYLGRVKTRLYLHQNLLTRIKTQLTYIKPQLTRI
jgi:hypothetical protein